MDKSGGAGKLQNLVRTLLPLVLMAVSHHGYAQLQLSGSQTARFSDNAFKTSTDETSDLESQTSFTASYISDPGQCSGVFSGTVGYSTWLDNSFESEINGNMNLDSQCELATGLYWDLNNDLREVRQDLTQSDTPNNRTRKNVFNTGPRYVWRLDSTDSLTFSTRYENTEYEEPENADSERSVSAVAWNHLFSETMAGGLSYSYSDTELDTGAELLVESANITWSKQWTSTRFSGALGVSEIETDFGATSQVSDGVVAEVDLFRELNPSTSWFVRGARELTDRTSSFDIRFEEFEFNLQESVAVETTTMSTGIRKRFSDLGSLSTTFFATRSDLLDTGEIEERSGLDFSYSQQLAPRVSGNSRLGYRYSKFDDNDVDDQVVTLEVGLSYLASRELNISGRLGSEKKTSDIDIREYDELFSLIELQYRFR